MQVNVKVRDWKPGEMMERRGIESPSNKSIALAIAQSVRGAARAEGWEDQLVIVNVQIDVWVDRVVDGLSMPPNPSDEAEDVPA